MSAIEKVKMWSQWEGEKIEHSGVSKNGTKSVESVKGLSLSLVSLFDQMVSDVLRSMGEARADLDDRVEQVCTTGPLCLVCRAQMLGDSLSAQCVGGRDLESSSDGNEG